MPTLDQCRREVDALHQFFVDWYAGKAADDAFEQFDRTLSSTFEMVTPDGIVLDRTTVVEWIEESAGKYESDDFDIEIRNVEIADRFDSHALVRYEEWQTGPNGTNGRVATALLRECDASPRGLAWVHVHETWLDR